jgi:hypothetical protein
MDIYTRATEDNVHGADLAVLSLDRFSDLLHLGNGFSGVVLGDVRHDVEGNVGVDEGSGRSWVAYSPRLYQDSPLHGHAMNKPSRKSGT